MPDTPEPDPHVVISAADARGALAPEQTTRGDTLLPMLVGSLVLIVIGIAAVMQLL